MQPPLAPVPTAPLVSVVIPAHNAAPTLDETLRSVLAQTYPSIEIIVVDDGSIDGTWALLQRYGPLVRAIRQPNAGIGAARNASVQAARGEYIALLDADDLCEPERIALQVDFLQRHPDVLLCSSDFSSFDERGPISASTIGSYYHQCRPENGGVAGRYPEHGSFHSDADPQGRTIAVHFGRVYERLAMGNFIHPPTVMFRRSALTLAGPFDPEVRIACEWDWFVRVARAGPVAYLDVPLLRYRRSSRQISSSPAMGVDSLAVARRIHQRDPELRLRNPRAVDQQLGNLSLAAANALVEASAPEALLLVLTSLLVYRVVRAQTWRVIAKALLPKGMLRGIRRLRGVAA